MNKRNGICPKCEYINCVCKKDTTISDILNELSVGELKNLRNFIDKLIEKKEKKNDS